MKTALITGITGQDGSYLAEYLLGKGYTVHGIKRRSSSFNTERIDHIYQDHQHVEDPRFCLHYGNLLDSARLMQLINEIGPDEVYNMASQSHVRVSFDEPIYSAKVNAIGVIRLLEAIRTVKPDTKFYQASSSEMFGQVQEVPQNEATAFHPRSPYGCAKVHAYWQTRNYREAYGMFASNGILFNHESPRRGETFLSRKVTMAATRIKEGLQDKLYLGYLGARRDWGFAGDYVEAIWLILQHERAEDFVISTGQMHTVREFVQAVFEYLDMDWKEYVVVDDMYMRPARVEQLQGDSSKARALLGWKPKTTFEGLVKMMIEADWKLAKEEKKK